jgi:hypothetical protein
MKIIKSLCRAERAVFLAFVIETFGNRVYVEQPVSSAYVLMALNLDETEARKILDGLRGLGLIDYTYVSKTMPDGRVKYGKVFLGAGYEYLPAAIWLTENTDSEEVDSE